ncbi:MAG: DJ-1/PfpI family protein [Oligoflexus sp.]|nr:DJ-1/PfpI family protein [Oligoflexus sp.]
MHILIPLPNHDFDPTEAAVPWRMLTKAGHKVSFATPRGLLGRADQRMVTGQGLGPLKFILMANKEALRAYQQMTSVNEFLHPMPYEDIHSDKFDGLLLPGGHAPLMKEYLDSSLLQSITGQFFQKQKPIAAICHGVVLASRSKMENGESALWRKNTTSLLKSQELLAWTLTAAWLGSYYRTYPQTVEDEVKSNLLSPQQFISGPSPVSRDTEASDQAGFAVRDGNYVSARWPGDAHRFSRLFLDVLAGA